MHARVRELVASVTRFHRCQIAVVLEYYFYCIEHEDGNNVFRRKVFRRNVFRRKSCFSPENLFLPEIFSGEKQFAGKFFRRMKNYLKPKKIVNGQNILVIGHKLT